MYSHITTIVLLAPPFPQASNLRELSDNVLVGMFDYRDHDHVHEHASPSLKVHEVSIPVLAVNSADDPFCPLHGGWGYCLVLEVMAY